jgi:hypothetical protein
MSKVKIPIRFLALPFAAFTFLSVPGFSGTLPLGGTDGLCTPNLGGPSQGVTTCLVNEGVGDTLLEEVVNFTAVPIVINSVTSGPITGIGGDNTDWILTDPVASGGGPGPIPPAPWDCLATPTLTIVAPGNSCTFNQSFTTDGPDFGPPMDGESSMSFTLGITPMPLPGQVFVPCGPAGGQVFGPGGLGLNYCFGANPGTDVNVKGTMVVTIESADVTVNDFPAPEPATLGPVGLVLTGLAACIFRRRALRTSNI